MTSRKWQAYETKLLPMKLVGETMVMDSDSEQDDALTAALRKSRVRENGTFDPNAENPLLTEDAHTYLARQWSVATGSFIDTADVDVSKKWFNKLWEMYTEPSRHYHTAIHLQEMLMIFDVCLERKAVTTQHSQITSMLAIFFHDAIYNVHSNTNEEDSARLFEDFARECSLSDSLRTSVVDWILATKSHKLESDSDKLRSMFLDLDMSVLGKAPAAYNKYAACIRSEYKHVPEKVYCETRSGILENFLLQSQIFAIPAFRAALEDQARQNVQNEIQLLKQGIIPE